MTTTELPWRQAWDSALYGEEGFFRHGRPAEHFRTSAHTGVFAEAVAELARRTGASTVVDLGSGGGELLARLRDLLDHEVRLVGVEVSARPEHLPPSVEWLPAMPDRVDGLVIANEWLDNLPCDVVELDPHGRVRHVLVDPATGQERLGADFASPWLDAWWPLTSAGDRAEVGLVRDEAWADVVRRVDGTAVAVDYGHVRSGRPPFGSLRSYASGREVDVVPDGSRDVTAHVAIDSVATAVGGRCVSQRDALADLGVPVSRPPIDLAASDPAAYVRELSRSAEAGELRARGGLGDFWWVVTGPWDAA